MGFRGGVLVAVAACLAAGVWAQEPESQPWGHSHLGKAYDTGMRARPWKMAGIGEAPFPITTKVPEVQDWFNQGNALLHSFWFEEAERSFRWCIKLDPDAPMPYLGLTRTGINWFNTFGLGSEGDRCKEFLRQAVARKANGTDHERMYIDAFEAAYLAPDVRNRASKLMAGLREIIKAYPDDIEARAMLGMYMINSSPGKDTEEMLKPVFAANPNHPGAHHYMIHTWDFRDPVHGLPNCQAYGPIAPGVGHANHMPGHIYSKIGMWKEAARSMDAATRVELRYMQERMALPFETWNFAHNRNYLCHIQEHLGQGEAAIRGAWDLINAPMDPDFNTDNHYEAQQQGMLALARALVRFEKWDDILGSTGIPKSTENRYADLRHYTEAHAHLGKGDLAEAEKSIGELKKLEDRSQFAALQVLELQGMLAAAKGDAAGATAAFTKAMEKEKEMRRVGIYAEDPPNMPDPVAIAFGDFWVSQKQPARAIEAYREALKQLPNTAPAYAGLAKAYLLLGMKEDAARAYGQVKYLWSDADPGLRLLRELEALGLQSEPVAETPAAERPYTETLQKDLGPLNWAPFPAPALQAMDSKGNAVDLHNFRGKNVILVFYLSDECVHCMEQLQALVKRQSEIAGQNCEIVAISSATPQQIADSEIVGKLPITLLSDPEHQNARRYASYDDFEEMELHSTILIDADGRVHWKRTGGDPFMNLDFLIAELTRIQKAGASRTSTQT